MLITPDEADAHRRAETAPLRDALGRKIAELLGAENEHASAIAGLSLFRCTSRTMANPSLHQPSLAVIVRGSKRVVLGNETYLYDESRFLLTAVDLPTFSKVLDASEDAPYLSIMLKLDLDVARQLIAQVDAHEIGTAHAGAAIATGPATPDLLDAVGRLVGLLETPQDIPILAKLVEREILYRVLTSPAGARLRQTVSLGTQSNRTARAIDWLRANYASPVRMEELADVAGMGVSTLHHHFRELTTMSPLQYQKHLRLHEARRLMLGEALDAGSAALQVGYESASQFSREYRRLFGAPPRRDVKALQSGAAARPPAPLPYPAASSADSPSARS